MKLVIRRNTSNPFPKTSLKDSEKLPSQVIGSSNACEVIRSRGSAIKILRSASVDLLVHEYSILKQLDHENIIRLASSKPFKMCKEREKVGLRLELGHIDMFDLLRQAQPSSLNTFTVKNIFKSIAKALLYMHRDKQLAHNDIKLQNILLFFNQNDSSDLTAKLIDFGLASSTSVNSSTICKVWENRSPNNLPPEIIEELNRNQKQTEQSEIQNQESTQDQESKMDLSKCDVFQFGLTLFNALFLSNPFECVNGNTNYQHFIEGNPMMFWNLPQIQNLLNNYASLCSFYNSSDLNAQDQVNQLIHLFNQLFHYQPSHRPDMENILKHPWFN